MRAFRSGRLAVGVCAEMALLVACNSYLPISPSSTSPVSGETASAFKVLHVFHAPARGWNPLAAVVADSAGNIYGETSQGGTPSSGGGCGTVFKVALDDGRYIESTLHRFRNKPDGCSPIGGLSIDSNGAIYGTTEFGGRTHGQGSGTVFKLSPRGSGYSYGVVYRFKDGRDGNWPVGGVLVDKSGVLYGATQYGASYACAKNTEGCGTVYRLTSSRSTYTETILYVFKGGNDGLLPISGLATDSSGALYGTTWLGGGVGSTGIGTVYKLTPSGAGYTERVIHAFQGGPNDGATPWAPVLVEPNGDVDGTTLYGGSNDKHCTAEGYGGNCGLVFRLTPSGSEYRESILYRFRGGRDGSQPQAPVMDDGGILYGTTSDDSEFPCSRGCGSVFALQPSGRGYAHTVLYQFNSRSGFLPRAGVILNNGALYGTTYYQGRGRSYAGGSVFKLTP